METLDQPTRDLNTALIITYCIFTLALCTTLARFFARARLLRQLGLDDWLIAGAMVIGIALVPLHLAISHAVHEMIQAAFHNGTREKLPSLTVLMYGARAARVNYVAGLLYLTEIGLIKVSLLAFYRRFLPRKPYHLVLFMLGACIIAFTVAASVAFMFQCQPISGAWDLLFPICRVDIPRLQLAICIFHLLTDLIILFLPIPVVRALQIGVKKKVGLIALFSVGALGTVVTALRLRNVVSLFNSAHDDLVGTMLLVTSIIKWSQLEINLVIICANIPALAALWRHFQEARQPAIRKPSASPQGSRGYHLGSSVERGLTASATGKRPSHSEGRVKPHFNDIVRSTTVTVKVEQAQPQTGI